MDDLAPVEHERLMSRFGKRFSAGQVIFREGDPGGEAYLLQNGRVRLIKRVRAVERGLMVLRPGDLFGESALLGAAARSSTAIALSDCTALALDHETFQHLLESNRTVALRIVQQLVKRLREAEDQIEIMMLRDTQSKIVHALLKLAPVSADAAASVVVPISPLELSTRVGIDIESVKRGVQKLRDAQYLRVVDEKLEIPDVGALRRLFVLLGLKDEIQGSQSPNPLGAGDRKSTNPP